MQIHFGQIYIEQGAYFPFTCDFQRYISAEVSSSVVPSTAFITKYGDDYSLIFRISAKQSLYENEIRGPTVFKKTKDVEFTIFLPFEEIMHRAHPPSAALNWIFAGVYSVFDRLDIEAGTLRERQSFIIKHICSDSQMFEDIDELKRFNASVSYLDSNIWRGTPAFSSLPYLN